VKGGVLTRAWHNWKFELGTGTCRYGGENIRTYPVRVRDGQVFVDITDPPAEVIRPDLFRTRPAAPRRSGWPGSTSSWIWTTPTSGAGSTSPIR
jgi:hypothetical protein